MSTSLAGMATAVAFEAERKRERESISSIHAVDKCKWTQTILNPFETGCFCGSFSVFLFSNLCQCSSGLFKSHFACVPKGVFFLLVSLDSLNLSSRVSLSSRGACTMSIPRAKVMR